MEPRYPKPEPRERPPAVPKGSGGGASSLPALALKAGSRVRVRDPEGTERLYVVERVRPVSDGDSVLLVLRPDR